MRVLPSVLMLALLSLPIVTAAEENSVVAIVFGRSVSASEILPSPTIAKAKKKELKEPEYQQWLAQDRVRLLTGLIEEELLNHYARQNHLEPSEDDLAAYRRMDQRMNDEERDREDQQVREFSAKLLSPSSSEAERATASNEIARIERRRTIREFGNKNVGDEFRKRHEAWTHATIQHWNVSRSLFGKYGGRVLLSSFGFHVPIDALMKFLKECRLAEQFQIPDPELEAAFWRHAGDDHWGDGKLTEQEAQHLFDDPPWRTAETNSPPAP